MLKESAGDDVNIYSLNRSSIPFPLLEPNQILHRKGFTKKEQKLPELLESGMV